MQISTPIRTAHYPWHAEVQTRIPNPNEAAMLRDHSVGPFWSVESNNAIVELHREVGFAT